jgi:hypothetical protein
MIGTAVEASTVLAKAWSAEGGMPSALAGSISPSADAELASSVETLSPKLASTHSASAAVKAFLTARFL